MRRMALCLLLATLTLPAAARADTLRLKNGNSISGIIKSEDEKSVVLEIGIGTVTFSKNELSDIERNTGKEEAGQMRRQWDEDKRTSEREQLRLQEEKAAAAAKAETSGEKVKVDGDTGHIITPAILNGKVAVKLIVDTGASLVVLSRKTGDKLIAAGDVLSPGKSRQVDMTLGDGRKVKADFVILKSVLIEGSVAEHVEAAIMPDDQTNPGYDGVLGMSFLDRFNFGFKRKEGRLILEPLKP